MKENDEQLWKVKGATLSDKSARKEYKLRQEEILEGINNGKLHYRVNYTYDNPWFRLLRTEVEKLVEEKHGASHLNIIKLKTELNQIEKERRAIKSQTRLLEIRKAKILTDLEIIKGDGQ